MEFKLTDIFSIILIIVSSVIGVLWAIFNAIKVKKIKVKAKKDLEEQFKNKNIKELKKIGKLIDKGANAFLFAEYKIMGYFIIGFGIIIFVAVDWLGNKDKIRAYTTISFIIGSVTSIVCGYIGMKIAVMANYRTSFKAIFSLSEAFETAYCAGCVMGFSMIGISLFILFLIIIIYYNIYGKITEDRTLHIFMEMVSGYGWGGSSMALFGRVGGGIFTKAADVGADLVGKVEEGLDEDSPKNPATIADNVGDNVGDIAGMGSDLFGSFAESTCAALVLIGELNEIDQPVKARLIWFPLTISATGLIACFLTSIVGIYVYKVNKLEKIQKALNIQLILSTLISMIFLFFLCFICVDEFEHEGVRYDCYKLMIPLLSGCLSGLIIGYSTDYFTSFSHKPVKNLAKSCTSGAALNIIFGLAVGYLSNIIPVIFICATIILAIYFCSMLGVALGALGMLSTLAISLAIDAYGPISDNAGGISEMAELGKEVRLITDALDSAGNTTAAVGKGFAIGSAALVSFALYGAFNSALGDKLANNLKITDGLIFGSMLFGAMLPYAFSALTMKSVGDAASKMVNEVRRQFKDPEIKNGTKPPDYKKCIDVSTNASLKQMIAPGCLIILTPIILGLIEAKLVIGLLPGSLVSGIQLAISMSNSGGAWDNAKKYIESGNFINIHGEKMGKGSYEHKAAVVGDTVGDPLKDTSGPSLNILVKWMAIISLVFAHTFRK